MKTLYYALIQPHLQYGILAWGNARSSALQKTVTLQKRAIRTINRAHYNSHTEPLFKKTNILKVAYMYEYQVVLFMHDYKNHKLPISFNKMYKFNYEVQAIYPTRQTELFHFEQCMSPFAEKLPRFNFSHIWNRWSPQIVNIASP